MYTSMRATRANPAFGAVGGLLCAVAYHQFGTWLAPGGGDGSPFAVLAEFLLGTHPLLGYLVLTLVGFGLGSLSLLVRVAAE
jgi:hypothetical protein